MLDRIHIYSCLALEYEAAVLADSQRRERRAASEHPNQSLHLRGPMARTWAAIQRRASSLAAHLRFLR